MKITSATFAISAPDLKSCPEPTLPEVAFIGRSNVGKSSMINLLTSRRDLAKVSATPGKTRMINFFEVNGAWMLVDLPGYGYAQASHADREEFGKAAAGYLEHRENLRRVFVLVDSRLAPQRLDLACAYWLADRAVPFSLIFTKADKLKAGALKKNIAAFMASLAETCDIVPAVFVSSSKDGTGRAAILAAIGATIEGRALPEYQP